MNSLNTMQVVAIVSLIAAILPLVASLFAAFHPSSRVGRPTEYFLDAGKLDIDSFLKTSIGYSLQAAAVYLFFSWSISYGVWAIIVPIAWTAGYLLLASAVRAGLLDGLLKNTSTNPSTIHGFIAAQGAFENVKWRKWTISILALATVIGVGGTMITEIDYATKIILRAVGLLDFTTASIALPVTQSTIVQITIILFVLLYVLWGGYKAVVITERYQVPVAYVGFVLFGVSLIFSTLESSRSAIGVVLLLLIDAALVAILFVRWRLLSQVPDSAREARVSAQLTFLPLIVLTTLLFLFSLSRHNGDFSLTPILLETSASFGFGVVGAISLIVTNLIWQFIDISSLQRLQSIADQTKTVNGRSLVAKAIRTTGYEAGLGWLILVLVGLSLRLVGFVDPAQLVDLAKVIMDKSPWGLFLVPLFCFAVSVFMLSTVSASVSALAYVSYADLAHVGSSTKYQPEFLARARLITLTTVAFLYVGYLILKGLLDSEDRISAALYAIYAFQIAIAPSVLAALVVASGLSSRWLSRGFGASTIIISTGAGLLAALVSSLQQQLLADYIHQDSLYVFPPLAALIVAAAAFVISTSFTATNSNGGR